MASSALNPSPTFEQMYDTLVKQHYIEFSMATCFARQGMRYSRTHVAE